MESPTKSKRCSACKQTIPEGEFYKSSAARDGLQSQCKKCLYATQKRYYARCQELPAPESKRCPDCEEDLPSSAFHKNRMGAGGLQTSCVQCSGVRRRKWQADNRPRTRQYAVSRYWGCGEREAQSHRGRRRRTGITQKQYEGLLAAQEGKCAICRKPPMKNALYVDHCHACGEIRSLLCVNCNRAIGESNEEASRIALGIIYLVERRLNVAGIPEYQYDKFDRVSINAQRRLFLRYQGGVCAICKHPAPEDQRALRKKIHVDHDHSTNIVRGSLCDHCNYMLGAFKDDVRSMLAATEYVRSHSKHHNPPLPIHPELAEYGWALSQL